MMSSLNYRMIVGLLYLLVHTGFGQKKKQKHWMNSVLHIMQLFSVTIQAAIKANIVFYMRWSKRKATTSHYFQKLIY